MTVIINGSNNATAGGVTYGDGSQYVTTAAGTAGQVLTSAGSSAPTWETPSVTSPAGSTGQLQYNDASSFGAVASGTSGQVLTSAGSGAAPTWSTPATGAMVFISEIVSTSSTTIDFSNVFSSTYDVYMITATNVGGSTTNVSLQALAEFGAGSYTAYNYYNRMTAAATSTFSYGSGNVFVTNTNNTGSNAQRTNFVVEIYNPLSTNAKIANFRGCSYSGFASVVVNWIMAALVSTDTSNQTGIRFSASAGTITGTFRLYGLKNS